MLRDSSRDPGIRFVVGAAVLSLVVFGLCCLGWAYPAVFLVVGAAAIAIGYRPAPDFAKPDMPRILTLFFLLFLILYFFNAMAPRKPVPMAPLTISAWFLSIFDGTAFTPSPGTFYALLSQGVGNAVPLRFCVWTALSRRHGAFRLPAGASLANAQLRWRHAGFPTARQLA